MRAASSLVALAFVMVGATLAPSTVTAQEPSIPSLMPLKKAGGKKKASAAPKIPSLTPAAPAIKPLLPGKKKGGPAPTTLAQGQQAIRLLSDFRKTQKFMVVGPSTMVVEVKYAGKKPKQIKFVIARDGKQAALLKIEASPVTQRLEIPEGSFKYTMVALPPRKLDGKVTLRVEAPAAPAEEPALVAESETKPPGEEPALAEPPTTPPPAPAAEGTQVAAADTGSTTPADAIKVLGKPGTMTLGGNTKRLYYQVDNKQPLAMTVRGPGSLWFELRRNVRNGQDAAPAVLEGRLDNDLVWTFRTRLIASQDKYDQTAQMVPGVREHVQLMVPAGDHNCELRLAENQAEQGVSVALDYSNEGAAPIMLVQRGAYLSGIASGAYGRDDYWPAIYEVNRQSIGKDPNVVEEGTKLVVPSYDDAKAIMKWIASGRSGQAPVAIAKLKGATPGLAGGDMFAGGAQMGDSMRRFLDHAVKDQVMMYLQAMVQSGAMEDSGVEVMIGDASGFDLGDVVVKIDDAPMTGERTGDHLGRTEILPGPHRMDVSVQLRGGSIFSYMKTTTFDVQGSHGFFVQAGKDYLARINIQQSGEISREFKDRIQVSVNMAPVEKTAVLPAPSAPAASLNEGASTP